MDLVVNEAVQLQRQGDSLDRESGRFYFSATLPTAGPNEEQPALASVFGLSAATSSNGSNPYHLNHLTLQATVVIKGEGNGTT